jgi:predicted DNA binding protein
MFPDQSERVLNLYFGMKKCMLMSKLMSLRISVKTGDVCWISRFPFKNSPIKVVEHQRIGDGGRRLLFRVSAGDDVGRVTAYIESQKDLHCLRYNVSKHGVVYGVAEVGCRGVCGLDVAERCILRCVEGGRDGWVEFSFIGTGDEFRRFMRRLADRGIIYKVLELSVIKFNDGLTSRQELIVRTALELGFFDYPRKIGVRELAQLFNVTPATMAETIRKAVKKIVKEYLSLIGSPELPTEVAEILRSR